ncbi:MAG: hypothetical protein FJ102_10355 [Deltaproteobacteria bacterium]|nr:hypothetical protein [Deltaproteobacteria bacterium]
MTIILTLPTALAGPVEWRALGGTQVDADSHGEVDLGLRSGPWVGEIYTDTLDLRWAPTWDRGRAAIGVRAEAFAAGLLVTPWSHGDPDPARELTASYAGPQASMAWYLPRGGWVGVDAHARYWSFGATDSTEIDVPVPHLSARGALQGGVWTPGIELLAEAGLYWAMPLAEGTTYVQGPEGSSIAQAVGNGISPFGRLYARAQADAQVAPGIEVRAGHAPDVGAVYAERVGGQMPYVVPLAGAAWGEFWAESYVATRLSLSLGDADAAPASGANARERDVSRQERWMQRYTLALDIASVLPIFHDWPYDPYGMVVLLEPTWNPAELGLAARAELRRGRGWLQAEAGLSPTLDHSAASGLLRLGIDWGTGAPW